MPLSIKMPAITYNLVITQIIKHKIDRNWCTEFQETSYEYSLDQL